MATEPRFYYTAGYPGGDTLSVDVEDIAECGPITDGVGFAHIVDGRSEGGWVLDFADLEDIYRRAKATRVLRGSTA